MLSFVCLCMPTGTVYVSLRYLYPQTSQAPVLLTKLKPVVLGCVENEHRCGKNELG